MFSPRLRSLAAAEVCLAVPVDGDALGDGARGPVGDLGDLAVDLDGPGADVLGADVVEGAVDLLALGPAVPAEVRREGVEVLALDDDVAVVVVERGRGVVGLVEGLGVVGDEGALARGRGELEADGVPIDGEGALEESGSGEEDGLGEDHGGGW